MPPAEQETSDAAATYADARRKSAFSYDQFLKLLHEEKEEGTTTNNPKPEPETKTKIAIIYHSLYGHVAALAESVKEGIEGKGGGGGGAGGGGATCDVYRVEETLPAEVLSKMGAPPPNPNHPVITAGKMEEYDGYVFGVSGRFGAMSAQMKTFMDSCGGLWQRGALAGKPAGTFVSVGTLGGGQETTHVSMISFFAHMGMAYVPLGYTDPAVFSLDEVHGASPYGCGTYAGPDGGRMPTELERGVAVSHGGHFAKIAAKLSARETTSTTATATAADAEAKAKAATEARRKSVISYEMFKEFLETDDDDGAGGVEAPPVKIAIIYYSLYGHIAAMAESIKKGVEDAGGTCAVFRVEETLPGEVLEKMGAPPKADHPVIAANEMKEYDGFIFGVSGRFGAMSAQMKTFMDSCGGLWQKGTLVGKSAGTFVSVGTLGGGQETTHVSMISFFAHMGMAYVPIGYIDPSVFSFDEVHGASPYGSGTYAGPDGSRMPTELERGVAETHGRHFTGITAKLAAQKGAAVPDVNPEEEAASG